MHDKNEGDDEFIKINKCMFIMRQFPLCFKRWGGKRKNTNCHAYNIAENGVWHCTLGFKLNFILIITYLYKQWIAYVNLTHRKAPLAFYLYFLYFISLMPSKPF